MSYSIEASVAEKILGRRDRAQLENELSKYPEATQKRWVANPAVEGLLQKYINDLIGNMRSAPSAPQTATSTKAFEKPTKKEKEPEKVDDDSDGEGMFGLFD